MLVTKATGLLLSPPLLTGNCLHRCVFACCLLKKVIFITLGKWKAMDRYSTDKNLINSGSNENTFWISITFMESAVVD